MAERRPNVLVIIVDNMPAAALGCYGNGDAYTPNLDRLAAQGVRFNNTYCANGVCSPSRASLMTGLMPSQHGIHSALPDQWDWYPEGWDALEGFQTLPQTMKDAGYRTALIGKFHMGSPYVPQQGFDHWVPDEHGHTTDFCDMHYVEDGEARHYDGHATEFWTQKAVDYLRDAAGSDEPFFLYLSYNAPYGDGFSISGEPNNPHGERFADSPMSSLPREPINTRSLDSVLRWSAAELPGFDFANFLTTQNNLPRMRNYFSQISYVDEGVGRVMTALQESGLDDDTLVVFTADHGICMGTNGVWGVSMYTFPSNGYQQSFNIPMLVRHTSHVSPLQESDLMVMQTDWCRTLLDYVGLEDVDVEGSPGRSLAPLLRGERLGHPFDEAFFEQEEMRAIRSGRWKFIEYFPGSRFEFHNELYDLERDTGEHHNLAADPTHAELIVELGERIDAFFSANSDPRYDLWKGGTARAYYAPQVQSAVWTDAFGDDWRPEFPPPD